MLLIDEAQHPLVSGCHTPECHGRDGCGTLSDAVAIFGILTIPL